MDAERYILSTFMKYDIVYADPPFPMEGKVSLLEKAAEAGIVKDGGLFIIHYPVEERNLWPESVDGFTFSDERKYGRSILRFYRKSENNA